MARLVLPSEQMYSSLPRVVDTSEVIVPRAPTMLSAVGMK